LDLTTAGTIHSHEKKFDTPGPGTYNLRGQFSKTERGAGAATAMQPQKFRGPFL